MRRPSFSPFAQGLFYVVSGLWPVVHLDSFQKATGDRSDPRMVRAVGGAVAALGAALVIGSLARRPSRALAFLGVGSGVALGAWDLLLARKGPGRAIYLGDAAAEAGAVASWVISNRGLLKRN